MFSRKITASLFVVMLIVEICIQNSVAKSFRTKRYSDPQEQLHRRRRSQALRLLNDEFHQLCRSLAPYPHHQLCSSIGFHQSEKSIINSILNGVRQLSTHINRRKVKCNVISRESANRIASEQAKWNSGVKLTVSSGLAKRSVTRRKSRSLCNNARKQITTFCQKLKINLTAIAPGIKVNYCG